MNSRREEGVSGHLPSPLPSAPGKYSAGASAGSEGIQSFWRFPLTHIAAHHPLSN